MWMLDWVLFEIRVARINEIEIAATELMIIRAHVFRLSLIFFSFLFLFIFSASVSLFCSSYTYSGLSYIYFSSGITIFSSITGLTRGLFTYLNSSKIKAFKELSLIVRGTSLCCWNRASLYFLFVSTNFNWLTERSSASSYFKNKSLFRASEEWTLEWSSLISKHWLACFLVLTNSFNSSSYCSAKSLWSELSLSLLSLLMKERLFEFVFALILYSF